MSLITQETIDLIKKRLVTVYDPEAMYLFGSYVWGDAKKASTLDLLVVINESTENRNVRVISGRKALWGIECVKELFVYTQEEFNTYAQEPSSLIAKVKKDGKVLYARNQV